MPYSPFVFPFYSNQQSTLGPFYDITSGVTVSATHDSSYGVGGYREVNNLNDLYLTMPEDLLFF